MKYSIIPAMKIKEFSAFLVLQLLLLVPILHADPYTVETINVIDENSLHVSRSGNYAVFDDGDNNLKLWSKSDGISSIALPTGVNSGDAIAINNTGQVLFKSLEKNKSITYRRRDLNGTFTINFNYKAPSNNYLATYNESLDDSGKVLLPIRILPNDPKKAAHDIVYYGNENAISNILPQILSASGKTWPPNFGLFLNNSNQAAYIVESGNKAKLCVLDLQNIQSNSNPASSIKLNLDIQITDFRDDGTLLLASHSKNYIYKNLVLTSAFRVRHGSNTLLIEGKLLDDDTIVGVSSPEATGIFNDDPFGTGAGGGAYYRTAAGEYKNLDCGLPLDFPYITNNIYMRYDDGSLLAEVHVANNKYDNAQLAILHPTTESLTQKYCLKNLETSISGRCGRILKNGRGSDLPNGISCATKLRLILEDGSALVDNNVLVEGATHSGSKILLKTDKKGEVHFNFKARPNSQDAILVKAPYRAKIKSWGDYVLVDYNTSD